MPAAAAASALVEALAATPGHLWVIIDQFHHAQDTEVMALVSTLADPQLQHISLVIASRAAVPLPLGRLRASGELFEAGAAALWFDPQETRAFLNLQLGDRIPLDTVSRVHEATAGWPAGVQLLVRSLREGMPVRAAAASIAYASGTPADDAVRAYFAEEIVAGVSPELMAFMQQLSLLDSIHGDLAAHVTGAAGRRNCSTPWRRAISSASRRNTVKGAAGTASTPCSATTCATAWAAPAPTCPPCTGARRRGTRDTAC